ncbi:MAG: hypothetical protein LBH47_00545 [Christensenellaceae bacterium]|jgi:V/A-type H+-transporting ATPase subunit I|nr:hypothetical protein [Christensenellaceae bacterium]
MKKVSISGLKKDLRKVVENLKSTANFQIVFYKNQNEPLSKSDLESKAKFQTQLNSVKNALEFVHADTSAVSISYDQLRKISKKEARIIKLTDKLRQTEGKINSLGDQMDKNQATITSLKPYTLLPVPLSLTKNTKHTFTLCGVMPQKQWKKYKTDINLSNYHYEVFPSVNDNVCVIVTGNIDEIEIANAITEYKFEPCPFDFNRTPAEEITFLTGQNTDMKSRYEELNKHRRIKSDEVKLLKIYYDYLVNELDTLTILSNAMQTKDCFLLSGWIPAQYERKFNIIMNRNRNIVVKSADAADTDVPPVVTKNLPWVSPFSTVTAMYGMPSKTDIDPNPFVAFFYFLFFGIMFGDAGYGLLLFGTLTIFFIVKRPRQNKRFLALFMLGGISAALWGIVFGSVFGNNLFGIQFLDPMKDAILFLALSLYLGVIQITIGNLLKIFVKLKNGKFKDAVLFALPHFALMFGLSLCFPSFISQLLGIQNPVLQYFIPWTDLGIYITLGGVAGIILFNGINKKGIMGKVVGSLSGAYGLVNYFSDILSYARLFGVGLAGSVIAYVANYLGGMLMTSPIGYVFGVLILVILHAINIGLGLLSAHVHNTRLQLIEFFSKFYDGEGKPFTPLTSNLRFSRIKT